MINVNGTHIVYGLIGEMLSKHDIVATDKKYMFATLRNCSYKPFGRNVITLYFDVDMELLLNFNKEFVSRLELIENTLEIDFSFSLLKIEVARSSIVGDFDTIDFLEMDEEDTDGLDSMSGIPVSSISFVCVVLSFREEAPMFI
jgi:hypothetical protein|tara:strand:- start:192 stop:623 length:432 start_codon:yes stop_codon:yes gene_type:complete